MLMRRWGQEPPSNIPREKIDRMRDLDTRIKRMRAQPDVAVEFMSGDFLKIMREILAGLKEVVDLLTLKLEQPRQEVQKGSGQVGRFLTPVHLM